MNNNLAKVGDVSIAAAVVAAIGAYATDTVPDIRVVYVLGGIGVVWMICRTLIRIVEIQKG